MYSSFTYYIQLFLFWGRIGSIQLFLGAAAWADHAFQFTTSHNWLWYQDRQLCCFVPSKTKATVSFITEIVPSVTRAANCCTVARSSESKQHTINTRPGLRANSLKRRRVKNNICSLRVFLVTPCLVGWRTLLFSFWLLCSSSGSGDNVLLASTERSKNNGQRKTSFFGR